MHRPLLCLALFAIGCHDGSVGGLGAACDATHGCADGLTCHAGHCIADGAPDAAAGAVGGNGARGDLARADEDMAGIATTADLAFVAALDMTAPKSGCGACNTPPDGCHAQVGTCQAGTCVYAFVDGATCDDGNPCTVADTCTNNGCYGTPMSCMSPPAAVCLSTSQARTYDSDGTCNGGLCVYAPHTSNCTGGPCVNGACSKDPCLGITCNAPPSVCYGAAGTCSGGSCSYPFADGATCDDGNACTSMDQCNSGTCKGVPMACDTPPTSVCANPSTLKLYAASGTCSVGACSYSYGFVTCPTGCNNGACNPSGWTTMSSNTNQNLNGVWGASATAVWAVGEAGTAVFYNGAQWQVRPLPAAAQTGYLVAVHGTSSSNVFALASKVLIHYDGANWSTVADLSTTLACTQTTGLWATGDAANDVYVTCFLNGAVGGSDVTFDELFRVSGSGTITPLGNATDPAFGCYNYSGGVLAFSSTDVIAGGCTTRQWNGTSLAPLGTATRATEFWAASPTALFGLYYQDGSGFSDAGLEAWNGTSWTLLNAGFDGTLTGLSGTAANRIFISGFDNSGKAALLYYDGVGYTQQTLPAGVSQLNAVWAAPTGEVFAVGPTGTIVKGP